MVPSGRLASLTVCRRVLFWDQVLGSLYNTGKEKAVWFVRLGRVFVGLASVPKTDGAYVWQGPSACYQNIAVTYWRMNSEQVGMVVLWCSG